MSLNFKKRVGFYVRKKNIYTVIFFYYRNNLWSSRKKY